MASVAAVQMCPPWRNWASMPCSAQNAPSSPTAASEASAMRIASAWPQRPMSVPILGHHESAKPPLRPDAP